VKTTMAKQLERENNGESWSKGRAAK